LNFKLTVIIRNLLSAKMDGTVNCFIMTDR
jgi:hypothetical protein